MSTSNTAPADYKKPSDYRLPTNVKATHYDLTFKTDLDALKFWGYAVVDLDILEDTDSIQFNAADIDLTDASVVDLSSGHSFQQVERSNDDKQERVLLKFPTTFKKGAKTQLSLGWSAALTGSMVGYYKSAFTQDGVKKHYSLTQFEPTAARRAYPSWDEPLLKAEYTVTMISRGDTVNLSNMPVATETAFGEDLPTGAKKLVELYPYEDPSKAKNEWKVTVFEKTPLMSSYLLAFANGDFKYLEDSYKSPISGKVRKLRIYATPDVVHQAKFALDIKRDCLPIYEKAFDVEFPLPKLDTLVAADFDAGAMENWGLITGRTTAFLYDEAKSGLSAKKRVATVQSHECAHMWFGDITTMSWWDALWLNEGFATLMGEVVIMKALFPEWKPHSSFITDHLESALRLDAQRSSHPIQVDCPDANQINQIFDALSYSKAASMLRMLSEYVGEEKFLKGVSIYLKNHLYGNSDPVDLWNGIAEATGLDIAAMMDNWVWKIGYPVISVKEKDGKLVIRQDRFLASGDATEEENKTIWTAPLNVLSTGTNGKTAIDRSIVLKEREMTIEVDTSKPWKLNAGTSGVYRVAYEPERLKQLGEWASQNAFGLEDRMGLVSDAVTLAKAGMTKTSAALDLIEGLRAEEENLVWQSIDMSLTSVGRLLWEESDEIREQWSEFRKFLFYPIVEKLGFKYSESDTPDVRELRTLAINACAAAYEPKTVAQLKEWFDKFIETGDHSIIPSDLQRITFVNAVKNGGQAEYTAVKKIWLDPPTPSTKVSALSALTKAKDLSIAKQTFEMLTNDEVPLQDWHSVVAGLGQNRYTRRLMTSYFYENYDAILERYKGNFSLSYIVKYTLQWYTTEKDAIDIEKWFKGKDVSKYNLALEQSLDSIRSNAIWIDRSGKEIISWISDFSKRHTSKL